MADQSGDASGGIPQPSVGSNSPFNAPSTVSAPTPSLPQAPLDIVGGPTTFGAAPSAIAMSAPGGGAVSAPGAGAPIAAPAGFSGGVEPPPGTGGNTFTDSTVGNQVFAMNQPGVSGGASGGAVAGAPTAGGTPGTGGHPTNSILNAIQNPGFNSILNAIGGNLGPLASLGILGFEAANKPGGIGGSGQQLPAQAQPGPVSGALVNTAQNLQAQGQQLSQPLATGALPPGAQSAVDQVTQEQEAQIRQSFAQMGLSGSSMETSAIANAQQAAQARGFAIAQQMAQQGLSDLSVSSGIFSQLLQSGLQSDQEFQQALTQFASSLAGGSGQTIKIAAG